MPAFASTRVVNCGNLAVSLLTLLVAFLLSLYSLSPSGRHLLFGRAITPDEAEASPLELFLTESTLHHWPASREPYFVVNRTDIVRLRLPDPASNFSVAFDSIESLALATSALSDFFETVGNASTRLRLSTLYQHVLLRQRFETSTAEQAPLRTLVLCPASPCAMTSTLLAFQRLTRHHAARRLAVFCLTLDAASPTSRAIEAELRANGVFTVQRPTNGSRAGAAQPTALIGALPAALQSEDKVLYHLQRGVGPSAASVRAMAYHFLAPSEATQGMHKASIAPFSAVRFSRGRALNNTVFDVVHLDLGSDLAVAALVYLTGLEQEVSEASLPRTIVLPLRLSEWAEPILDSVVALQSHHHYHLYALGGNATGLDSSATLVDKLREEVRQRMAPSLRSYWSHSAPLCYLVLSQTSLQGLVDDIPSSARKSGGAQEFFSVEQGSTGTGLLADVYPFNDGVVTNGTSSDVAGKVGGMLYTYLALVTPFALYMVPLIICVVLLRNFAKRCR